MREIVSVKFDGFQFYNDPTRSSGIKNVTVVGEGRLLIVDLNDGRRYETTQPYTIIYQEQTA